MSTNDQPTDDEIRLLKEMGMTEVEPGRWSSSWTGSDPGMQEWLDNLGGEGEEQLDLLTRAGRVQNEFDMEQSGGIPAANVQQISQGPLTDHPPHAEVELATFVAVRESSASDFDALDGEAIELALHDAWDSYPMLAPPDAIAVALRKVGIKCKTIEINPHTAGPDEGPDPRDYPGFRAALLHFPGARKIWLD